MAFLNIPKGKSEFEKIRREGLYYVDKTGLIGEILKSSGTQVRTGNFKAKGYLRCVDEPVACDEFES